MLTCPPITEWKRLLRGDIAGGDADILETHLDACDTCRGLVGGFRIEDSLVEAIPNQKAWPQAGEDLLPGLIQRMKGVLHSSSATHLLSDQASEDLAQLRIHFTQDGSRLGQHRLVRHVGTGGMGIVFEAEDEELKRRVALKIMKPALAASTAARQRFLREGQAMAALDHPHIVRIHQVGENEGRPFFAMEFLCGETLAERLQRAPRPAPKEIACIGRQIALALAAAHERGLVHRDIKPGNVFLVMDAADASAELGARSAEQQTSYPPHSEFRAPRSCHVKILDFGLVHAIAHDARLTRAGDVLGTPDYMSPEQARGQPVDARSDLFSLGCVLYELCSGFTPFQAANSSALLAGLDGPWPKPLGDLNPGTPPALAELITHLLAKNPDERPASAQEIADALQSIERGEKPAWKGPPPKRLWSRRRVFLAGIASLLVVSFLLILPALFTKDPPLTGSWTRETPLALARARIYAMAAEMNGVLYLVGGDPTVVDLPNHRRLDTLEGFHTETRTWKSLAPMPQADENENGRSSGSLGVIDGKLYLAGGWRHKPPLPTKTLLIYDPRSNTWDIGKEMPEASADSVGGVIGRKFYVLIGTNGNDGLRRLFFAYDPELKSWQELQPAPRLHSQGAAGVIGGKLYVVGGGTEQGVTGGLDVYDPAADSWASSSPMPTPRRCPAAAVVNGHLVVLGGNDDKGKSLATVEAYNPQTNRWTRLPDLPDARNGATAAVVGSKLYVLGGQRLGVNLASFDVFTLSANSR